MPFQLIIWPCKNEKSQKGTFNSNGNGIPMSKPVPGIISAFTNNKMH